jgi:hypothetical protein
VKKWPAILPLPSHDYQLDVSFMVIRSRNTDLIQRTRSRGSRVTKRANFKWQFDDTEFELFQAFYVYDTDSGASWFEIDLPVNNAGLIQFKVRFADGKFSHTCGHGLFWTVTATMEIEQI